MASANALPPTIPILFHLNNRDVRTKSEGTGKKQEEGENKLVYLRSILSKVLLAFKASAKATPPCGEMRLFLKSSSFRVVFAMSDSASPFIPMIVS